MNLRQKVLPEPKPNEEGAEIEEGTQQPRREPLKRKHALIDGPFYEYHKQFCAVETHRPICGEDRLAIPKEGMDKQVDQQRAANGAPKARIGEVRPKSHSSGFNQQGEREGKQVDATSIEVHGSF